MLRKSLGLGAFFLGIGGLVTPVEAHWQFTRWGMTPAQVEAVGGGKVAELSPADSAGKSLQDGSKVAKLAMPYASGSNAFKAIFLFDRSGGLCAVQLEQVGGSADALRGDMLAKYGKPRDHSSSAIAEVYWWDAGDDEVSLRNIGGDMVSLWYAPRITANNSGL